MQAQGNSVRAPLGLLHTKFKGHWTSGQYGWHLAMQPCTFPTNKAIIEMASYMTNKRSAEVPLYTLVLPVFVASQSIALHIHLVLMRITFPMHHSTRQLIVHGKVSMIFAYYVVTKY
jgi:hypothetical protein